MCVPVQRIVYQERQWHDCSNSKQSFKWMNKSKPLGSVPIEKLSTMGKAVLLGINRWLAVGMVFMVQPHSEWIAAALWMSTSLQTHIPSIETVGTWFCQFFSFSESSLIVIWTFWFISLRLQKRPDFKITMVWGKMKRDSSSIDQTENEKTQEALWVAKEQDSLTVWS